MSVTIDEINDSHPLVWYDDYYSGGWWGQGHLTTEEFIEGAIEQDGYMDDPDAMKGRTLEHCWRTPCVDGHFDCSRNQSDDYPHPVTRLI